MNPDFGQVEQDPAVLNLSVFETFFPEKRPFFLEDSRTFVPPSACFSCFTRAGSGGARPFTELTTATRSSSVRTDHRHRRGKADWQGDRWTYGALTALTAREYAQVERDDATGEACVATERLLEPLTSYNVARVQRDVLNGHLEYRRHRHRRRA